MTEEEKQPVKVLQVLKVNYPSQRANVGSVAIKIILAQQSSNAIFVVMGEGEDTWLIKNGRALTFKQASKFFSNLNEVKHLWIGPEEEE